MRHRDDLVRRELDDAGKEADLIARLRDIYKQQGIDVPDSVLRDGVTALKDSRFTYDRKPPGWKRTLLEAWTRRRRIGAFAGAGAAAFLSTFGVYHVSVTRPAQQQAEQARVEVSETLPAAVRKAHADVVTLTTDPAARERAEQFLADGERAARDKDRAGLGKAAADLAKLKADLLAEYTLTIVSRPGEQSGVWRRPPAGSQARNYYLVVEAISPDGRKLALPVRNEETGATSTVEKFAVRVPQSAYDAVAADKRDDGIVQKNIFGVKRRGSLGVEYRMPFEGGSITKW
jgi:hypothetical protein